MKTLELTAKIFGYRAFIGDTVLVKPIGYSIVSINLSDNIIKQSFISPNGEMCTWSSDVLEDSEDSTFEEQIADFENDMKNGLPHTRCFADLFAPRVMIEDLL